MTDPSAPKAPAPVPSVAPGDGLSTHFAPAGRATERELRRAIEIAANSPVTTALLEAFGTLLAVLNTQRQIVAVNRPLLEHLGLDESCLFAGMRPGEALGCIHPADAPDGCGTSEACRTCGAAIAIVTSMDESRPADAECLLQVADNGAVKAIEFQVRATPVVIEGFTFTVLSLEDIRDRKRRQAMERVFFHDVLNELQALTSHVEIMELSGAEAGWRHTPAIRRLTHRLAREVQAQRDFALLDGGEYQPMLEPVRVGELWGVLTEAFAEHRVAHDRTLTLQPPAVDLTFHADRALLERVLENMVKNALEATDPDGTVRVWAEPDGDTLRFRVWNHTAIPADVAPRVFQRFFSTKPGNGRGLGTYGMKLLGERYLGGRVSFTSSPADGTVFELALPLTAAGS